MLIRSLRMLNMTYKEPNPFYKSKKWKQKRKVILKLHDYECQESRQYGDSKQADLIHHVYPLKQYPELALVNWNLLPLAEEIHNTFHNRKTDEVIGRGLYWQRKRKREFDKFYEDNF